MAEYLPSSHEALGLVPALQPLAEVVDICHSGTLEVEVGDSEVQAHLRQHKELEASLGYQKKSGVCCEQPYLVSSAPHRFPGPWLFLLSPSAFPFFRCRARWRSFGFASDTR